MLPILWDIIRINQNCYIVGILISSTRCREASSLSSDVQGMIEKLHGVLQPEVFIFNFYEFIEIFRFLNSRMHTEMREKCGNYGSAIRGHRRGI